MLRLISNTVRKCEMETAGCGFLSPREIDAAVEGRLPESRQEAFDAHQLEGCPSCSLLGADLQIFRSVEAGHILESERREFNQTAAIFKAELRQKLEQKDAKRSKRFGFGFSWNAAATLAAAAMVAVALMVPALRGPDNVIELPGGDKFAVQAMAWVQPLETRGVNMNDLWDRAGAAYQGGEYATAADLFSEIERRDPLNHDAALYRGISLVMTGEHDQAIEPLRRASKLAEEYGLYGTAHYFLGLAAIGQDQLVLAAKSFERAEELGGQYEAQAREMLDRLMAE